jgi:hypothetical protein
MKRLLFFATALAAIEPMVAIAEPISWQRYAVPETGAAVDIPNAIFTAEAGKPELGYGRRFFTSDGRANLTVQSVPNDSGDSPATFLAKVLARLKFNVNGPAPLRVSKRSPSASLRPRRKWLRRSVNRPLLHSSYCADVPHQCDAVRKSQTRATDCEML